MLFDNPETSRIFVFGSNERGRHGKGAALHAVRHYGAVEGVGEGWQGRAYAIPTKDRTIKTLPLKAIEASVDRFLLFTMRTPNLQFNVTQIGCGLAGYDPQEIAPMFKTREGLASNVWYDSTWKPWLAKDAKFWRHPI